ncbi:MAG: cytochrome c [Betaproteobacteria bacterium]
MKIAFTIVTILLLITAICVAQGSSRKPASDGSVKSIDLPAVRIELRDGEGRVKTESSCNICHSVDYITMQPKFSRAQWSATVTKMIKTFGAPINEEDAKAIIAYLSTAYGTGN